jgi:4-hydroxybutyryl-CoA dehydratase/vinylacetyl-CoA-Delta-isomerase
MVIKTENWTELHTDLTMGVASVGYKTESMHGAGSPQAQRIMIAKQGNLEEKKELVKKILDIE